MPVDRARRDAFASALSAFLRREIGRDELGDALMRLIAAEGSNQCACDISLNTLIGRWFDHTRHGPITEQKWIALCRALAFLKTDLDDSRFNRPDGEGEESPCMILFARWNALGLLVALGVSYFVSWWIFAAATLFSFLLFQAWMRKHDSMASEEWKREIQRRLEYYPFADDAEWLAHKHHLDQFVVPDYDATAFGEPTKPGKWSSYWAIPVGAIYCVIIGAVLLYMVAFSVAMWPISLVMMSLCRPGRRRAKNLPCS